MALLDLILGYDCNLACDYCTITVPMRARALSTVQVLRALEEGRALGYDELSITGGEPTIRADLVGLVRAARARGYRDIKLQSNGLLYARGANVDALRDAGVDRFHVSVHTHDRARYDHLVQREGAHAVLEAGLGELVQRGVTLVADLIVKSDTYRDLPEAAAWLHARGIRHVDLWFVSLTDGNRENVDSMPSMTQAIPFMRATFAWARAHEMKVRSLHVPRCLMEADAPHAWDPGSGRVLVVTPDSRFELKDSRLAGREHVPACVGCVFEPICPGLRPDYLEHYGDGEIAAARGMEPTLPARRRSLPMSAAT